MFPEGSHVHLLATPVWIGCMKLLLSKELFFLTKSMGKTVRNPVRYYENMFFHSLGATKPHAIQAARFSKLSAATIIIHQYTLIHT